MSTNAVTETTPFNLDVQVIDGEPRVLDTDLAKALGMVHPTNIRATIESCRSALEDFGPCTNRVHEHPTVKGRTVTAYSLNEEQALYVTMHCRTDRAATKWSPVYRATPRGKPRPAEAAGKAYP